MALPLPGRYLRGAHTAPNDLMHHSRPMRSVVLLNKIDVFDALSNRTRTAESMIEHTIQR